MFTITLTTGGGLIFGLARRMFGAVAAGLAGLTYVTLAGSPVLAGTVNLTEIWAAPFAILAIYAMARAADKPSGSRRAGWFILLIWIARIVRRQACSIRRRRPIRGKMFTPR